MHTVPIYNNPIYKNQRVAVFLDVQNLYYSARDSFNRKVDFEKVLKKVLADRILVRAIAYLIKLQGVDQKGFINTLRHIGYEVKVKEPKIFTSFPLHRPATKMSSTGRKWRNCLPI